MLYVIHVYRFKPQRSVCPRRRHRAHLLQDRPRPISQDCGCSRGAQSPPARPAAPRAIRRYDLAIKLDRFKRSSSGPALGDYSVDSSPQDESVRRRTCRASKLKERRLPSRRYFFSAARSASGERTRPRVLAMAPRHREFLGTTIVSARAPKPAREAHTLPNPLPRRSLRHRLAQLRHRRRHRLRLLHRRLRPIPANSGGELTLPLSSRREPQMLYVNHV
jgi:hypothetical protein